MAAPFESNLVTRALHAANRIYARCFHHVRVHGPNVIPRDGPAMLIANHRSGVDPLLIMSISPRPIRWMMAKEYENIIPLNLLVKPMHTIAVSRNGKDSSALREAMRALSDGALLGVFPEGKIETSDAMWPFQTGAAMIALRAGVPVIPIYHRGVQLNESMVIPFMTPQTVDLYIGPAIDLRWQFGKSRDFEAPTALLEAALHSLSRPPSNGGMR